MDLDSKTYAELQSIAKELGLKANMKAQKLLKAIKQHYQQEQSKDNEEQKDVAAVQEVKNAAQDHVEKNKDSTCLKEVSSTTVFVNIRRGKGYGTKRKISDTARVTEYDAKGDAEVAVSSPRCGARSAKQRKVPSVSDSDKTGTGPPQKTKPSESEQQPGIKDEDHVPGDTEKAPKVSKAGKIPRYQGLQQKNKPVLKPFTPNFKKLHEAHFNKMESIDSYVQRKSKQMDVYRNSAKELKTLSDKTKLQEVKTQAKANHSHASMLSPVPVNKRLTEAKRHTLLSGSKAPSNKPAGKEDAPFTPSVLSTRRFNVQFSEATRDNEYKRSLVKTPARMSLCVTSSTPQKQTTDAMKPNSVKTSTLSATKNPGPFVFTGNTSISVTPGTQKKLSFDLKASLSRPLTYKPHKGKLKPFGEVKESATTAGNTSTISNSHQKNYKQHQVKTREDRRAKHTEQRKQKKESMLGARRGLVMM